MYISNLSIRHGLAIGRQTEGIPYINNQQISGREEVFLLLANVEEATSIPSFMVHYGISMADSRYFISTPRRMHTTGRRRMTFHSSSINFHPVVNRMESGILVSDIVQQCSATM
jgi:hypothetical protein